MNHIPPYLFLSRADDDDIRELGKPDFCSVLVHLMLSNANHFTSLFCRERFRIVLKCVRHVRHAFSPPPYSTNHILSLWRCHCFRRCDVDDSEDATRKCNFAFLLSFVDYSRSFVLKTVLLTSLNSIRMNALEITTKKKYKFVYVRLGRPHKWKIDDLTSLIWWEWLRNAQKRKTHVQSVQNYFFSLSNLWLFCRRLSVWLLEWNSSLQWS